MMGRNDRDRGGNEGDALNTIYERTVCRSFYAGRKFLHVIQIHFYRREVPRSKDCFKALVDVEKDSIENGREGRGEKKKKIQKPSFYGKHQRIGGVSKFEGKKKRKLKFPSIHVSIANESVDIEIRRSRNVVANLSPPSPLRVKDDREGRYLLRRTDQDSILVPIHFETVCQSGDSNPTL